MIIGHQKIISFLERSIEKGAISQSYIFSGPQSTGKFSLAVDFAEKLTGKTEAVNPNLTIISSELETTKEITRKKPITVEQIRELKRQLGMTAHGVKYRVAIIDDADWMNGSAQNALLKTLEEPMESVAIILIVSDLGKIFPTIRSRCQIKKFSPVPDSEIEKHIPSGEKEEDDLVFWSLGRPGLLFNFLKNKNELKKRKEAKGEFQGIFSKNIAERFALAQEMSKDTVALAEKMNWWLVMLRKKLINKSDDLSPDKTLRLIERIGESLSMIRETNASARLILENLLLEF